MITRRMYCRVYRRDDTSGLSKSAYSLAAAVLTERGPAVAPLALGGVKAVANPEIPVRARAEGYVCSPCGNAFFPTFQSSQLGWLSNL